MHVASGERHFGQIVSVCSLGVPMCLVKLGFALCKFLVVAQCHGAATVERQNGLCMAAEAAEHECDAYKYSFHTIKPSV